MVSVEAAKRADAARQRMRIRIVRASKWALYRAEPEFTEMPYGEGEMSFLETAFESTFATGRCSRGG